MEINSILKESINEVLKEKKQAETYSEQFTKFIKNYISGNWSDEDIKMLLKSLKIEKEGE